MNSRWNTIFLWKEFTKVVWLVAVTFHYLLPPLWEIDCFRCHCNHEVLVLKYHPCCRFLPRISGSLLSWNNKELTDMTSLQKYSFEGSEMLIWQKVVRFFINCFMDTLASMTHFLWTMIDTEAYWIYFWSSWVALSFGTSLECITNNW